TAAVRAGVFASLAKPCATPDLLLTLEQARRYLDLQTDKRELQRRAQMSEKLAAVGTMTAGLSHEIRNPLNAASLQLAVLERRVRKLAAAEQAPILEPLRLVRDEIGRLEHLLQDFVQFARPRELNIARVDAAAAVESVVGFLVGEADERRITLEHAVPGGLAEAAADPELLRQTL